jgi:hypothetical protein
VNSVTSVGNATHVSIVIVCTPSVCIAVTAPSNDDALGTQRQPTRSALRISQRGTSSASTGDRCGLIRAPDVVKTPAQ